MPVFGLPEVSRLAPRVLLFVVIAAAPWHFGSVTPRAASILTASLLILSGVFWAMELLRGRGLQAPPAWPWIAIGLALVLFQSVPWPASLSDLLAPGVGQAYRPLRDEPMSLGWHPLSLEPFQTRWLGLQLLGLVAAFHLANRLSRRSSDRNLFAYVLTALGVALSLFAVYQKSRFGNLLYGSVHVESGTPFGPFVNHNHFAGYAEACALVALGAALGSSRRSSALSFLLGGSAVLIGIAHLLSHSRGGLLALGAGLLTLVWLFRGDEARARRLILAGGGIAVALFLLFFGPSSLFQRVSTFSDPAADESFQFRVRLWSDSVRLWEASPVFGTGLGTYAAAIPPYRSGPDETRAEYAESDWLQILCEGGIAGIAVLGAFLFSILRSGYRDSRAARSERAQGVGYGASAAAVALVAHGLVDFNFRIPSNALLFAVLLGMLAPEGRRLTARPGRLWRLGGSALLLALGLFLAGHALRLGASQERNLRINPLLAEPFEFTDLIRELARSRDRVPGNPHTSFLLGRLYNEEAYRSRERIRYRELRLEQARAAFGEAVTRAPARGRYWFELAWTEASLGNDEPAERLFTLALELEPHWSNLRANYALYLISRGRIDEALAQIEVGRDLDPGIAPAEALALIGPYLGGDSHLLRQAAGEGEEAERALAAYRGPGE
jgi:O-antigen ligase